MPTILPVIEEVERFLVDRGMWCGLQRFEVLSSQPASFVVTRAQGGPFKRLYICLEGYKKGFLAGCRPFIGLDACHLKNKSGGQLITVVCKDTNEEYFPFAYAVVEAETNDSWTWFINLLLVDIGQNRRWVFMLDQQKVCSLFSIWLFYSSFTHCISKTLTSHICL